MTHEIIFDVAEMSVCVCACECNKCFEPEKKFRLLEKDYIFFGINA